MTQYFVLLILFDSIALNSALSSCVVSFVLQKYHNFITSADIWENKPKIETLLTSICQITAVKVSEGKNEVSSVKI